MLLLYNRWKKKLNGVAYRYKIKKIVLKIVSVISKTENLQS